MLIEFTFSNFKSFKNEVTLDMSASKITELPHHVRKVGKESILPVAAIYGANASGKSNVFQAFYFMSRFVARSFEFGGDNPKDRKNRVSVKPFLFDRDSRNLPSTFEVLFIIDEGKRAVTYQYGFSIIDNQIVEEWLFSKAKTSKDYKEIFYREGNQLQAEHLNKKSAELLNAALTSETLVVSLGARLKIKELALVRDWFMDNEMIDFGNPAENFYRSFVLPERFVSHKSAQDEMVDYIGFFDDSITGFHLENIPNLENPDDEDYSLESQHKRRGTDENVLIPFSEESSGTQKMFCLYHPMRAALNKGSVFMVDELNARLHPLLMRNLILTFTNEETNPHNAQLIFTTHDVFQFSNEMLRRDEIWITEKDKEESSSLYSVSEFKTSDGRKSRKGEALARHYLTGEYGGVPNISSIKIVSGENSHER